MALDLATIASASHLSREDRRAYLRAMEAEAQRVETDGARFRFTPGYVKAMGGPIKGRR